MKETTFTTPVHSCSSCDFWSLRKDHVQTHIQAKCPTATVVSQEKSLTHKDVSFELDDKSTLHQCSQCGYTSTQITHVRTHIRAKCKGAVVESEKRKLVLKDPVPSVQNTITTEAVTMGEHNSNNNIINKSVILQVNIQPHPCQSPEEFAEYVKIFYKVTRENINLDNPVFMPSELLKGLEKATPALDNKMFTNK